jgi:hypothetical protein
VHNFHDILIVSSKLKQRMHLELSCRTALWAPLKLRGTIIPASRSSEFSESAPSSRASLRSSFTPDPNALRVPPPAGYRPPSTCVTLFSHSAHRSDLEPALFILFPIWAGIGSYTNSRIDDRSGYGGMVTFVDGDGDFSGVQLEGSSSLA